MRSSPFLWNTTRHRGGEEVKEGDRLQTGAPQMTLRKLPVAAEPPRALVENEDS